MPETEVPYTRYWDNEVGRRVIHIHPDPQQFEAILPALNERRLTIDQLQEFGSAGGICAKIDGRPDECTTENSGHQEAA